MSEINKVADNSIVNLEDHECISVRRKRRCSNGPNEERDSQIRVAISSAQTAAMATPPATPHRTKKRVRFSEPGSSPSATGLTPFFCRNSISSPPPSKSRRASTPFTRFNLAVDDTPILSGILQFGPYRQGLSGRAKRALRRRGLSEELNQIKMEEKLEEKSRRMEIERLEQDHCEDQELRGMRDQQDLSDQIGGEAGTQPLDTFDDDFNVDMTEVYMSTPGRVAFPSPPATNPNTPSKSISHMEIAEEVQVVDDQRLHLQNQLRELQDKLPTLKKTLELTNTLHERLIAKLSPFMDESVTPSEGQESLDIALDSVLTQLALTESSALDNATRFSALTHEIDTLFPSSAKDPESILKAIQDQFRAARLELEYLAPGENPEGFDNTKLLDMLISRLRMLTDKVTQQETDIDQYHAQELSLRLQLGSRIDTQTALQDSLTNAGSEIRSMKSDIQDRDNSISKLGKALQGYRDEVAGLELLVTNLEANHAKELALTRDEMEKDKKESENRVLDLQLQQDTLQAIAEGREMIMAELERRLSAALTSSQSLKDEMTNLEAEKDSTISKIQQTALDREKSHGDALALRDARVAELRREVERVNAGLKDAYATIMALKRDRRDLTAQVDGVKLRGEILIGDLLSKFQETCKGYRNGGMSDGALPDFIRDESYEGSSPIVVESPRVHHVTKAGGIFDSASAKRIGKKRRRYDSGLGFLDELEEEEETMTVGWE